MKKWFLSLGYIERIVVIITLSIISFGLIKAAYYTKKYGGTDLRIDIVGTRALQANQSPYFYHWSVGDPETLANPNGSRIGPNGLTMAPGMLFLYSAISRLNYPTIRIVWTIFQYLLMLWIFFFSFERFSRFGKKEIYAFLIAAIGFLASSLWLENIERGQKYVFYAFLFCAIWQLLKSNKGYLNFLGGIILAAAIYCRPTFIVITIPLIWVTNRKFIFGFLISALLLTIHGFTNIQLWKDYSKSMRFYTDIEQVSEHTQIYPEYKTEVIEGASNIRLYNSSFICGGIHPFPTYFKYTNPNQRYIWTIVYVILVGMTIYLFRSQLRSFSIEEAVLLGFLLYMIAEYFIPNDRGGYNPIQWAFPVIMMLRRSSSIGIIGVMIATGICLMLDFPFYFPGFHTVGELLLVISLVVHLRNRYSIKPRQLGNPPKHSLI